MGGQTIVSRSWVESSVKPQVEVDDDTKYGYLWWLREFGPHANRRPIWLMQGNGGNKVAVFPDLDMSVVITSTNYSTRGVHEQTDTILNEYVVPAVIQ